MDKESRTSHFLYRTDTPNCYSLQLDDTGGQNYQLEIALMMASKTSSFSQSTSKLHPQMTAAFNHTEQMTERIGEVHADCAEQNCDEPPKEP